MQDQVSVHSDNSYQEQENYIYQIFEQKQFASVQDQVIKSFKDLGIPPRFDSFSVTLNFILNKNEPKRKENINVFQTGMTHRKNLIISIMPTNIVKITFRQGQDQEFLFSQTKIKPNIEYELVIVYEVVLDQDQQDSQQPSYNATLYINGKSETSLSMNEPVTKPSGMFYFGSESATSTFVGEISHTYFVTRNLTEGEITSLHEEKRINPMDPKSPYAILEEAQQTQIANKDNLNNTIIPANLQRTHVTLQQNHNSGQSQMVVLDTHSIKSMDKGQFEQAELNAIFMKDQQLLQECRNLTLHFEWTICTLQQLSPAITEPDKSSLPFTCLHNLIATGKIPTKLPYPIYIIELKRFMKVLRYAEVNISEASIIQLANVTNTYYEFQTQDPDFKAFQEAFEVNYKYVNKNLSFQTEEDSFRYRGILYNKLLIAIRDTVLEKEEVTFIQSRYIKQEDYRHSVNDGIIGGEYNQDQPSNAGTGQEQFQQTKLQGLGEEGLNIDQSDQQLKQRQELKDRLQLEKAKTLNCLPLAAPSTVANQPVVYNSYNALLYLLDSQKKSLQEAQSFDFKGIFLQRPYPGSHDTNKGNILDLHKKFYATLGSKMNLFTQLEQLHKNMCSSALDDIDFNSFQQYWLKTVQNNDDIGSIQSVFEDLQYTKNGFVTLKDLTYYLFGYELVFLYQKRGTDTHISLGVLSGASQEGMILRSESPPAQSAVLRQLQYTTKKLNATSDTRQIVLPSFRQSFRTEKNEMIELKGFDDYSPETGQQYEQLDVSSQGTCFGLEVTAILQANNRVFGNQVIEYAILTMAPIFKANTEQSLLAIQDIHSRQAAQLGGISVERQPSQNLSEQNNNNEEQQLDAEAAPEPDDKGETLPVFDQNWNTGAFKINVNRCTNCDKHLTTTWHEEVDFIEKFNQFGEYMKACFPNCEIIGNHDQPGAHLENFDVYIRGVGPEHDRDEQGRILLYQKSEGIFSFLYNFTRRILQAYDRIVLLSAGYKDTIEMQKIQDYYFSRFKSMIAAKWEKSHGFPCEVPERKVEIVKKKQEEQAIKDGTKMVCRNWGCGQTYDYQKDPDKHACKFHPGSYQLGSIHALWPESWTCCRGEWTQQGCRKGIHKGVVERKLKFLCLNTGEINPKTKRPDSACGLAFNDDNNSDCVVHSGYFKLAKITSDEGEWTCCKDGNISAPGCANLGAHKKAEWPDPDAKKYFVEKPIFNPGLIQFSGKKLPVLVELNQPYQKTALNACVYRESKAYVPFVNELKRQMEERKLNENEFRICLRHGCQKKTKDGGDRKKALVEFTDFESEKAKEKRKKNCSFHTGSYDFGHTGVTTVSQASTDTLWKPHWTCCRGEWDSDGCEHGYHDGPLRNDFVDNLVEKARLVLDEAKQIEEKQRFIKKQEDMICERYVKDENEKNNELAKLPNRYNEDLHKQVKETVEIYQNLIDQSKKNPRVIIDFYEREFWPNPRAMKKFHKIISRTWKNKLEGYKIGAHEVHGLYVDENDIKNTWAVIFKKENSASFGRLSTLCDKLHLHLFAVSDRLDYHFKFWDMVNRDLKWFTQSDEMTRDQFIQWWFMDVDSYLNLKQDYQEEQSKKK